MAMLLRTTLAALCALVVGLPAAAGERAATAAQESAASSEPPLSIFIRSSEQTYPTGQHDYPRFLEEWKALLAERGAVADGGLRFPTEEELAGTDLLVLYTNDGGTMTADERRRLEAFLKGGGGLAILHDGMCSDEADWFAEIAGGAKQHGERNWWRGVLQMRVKDAGHPIVEGISDFEMDDEGFFLLRTSSDMHVLATAEMPDAGEVPQLWTYENTLPGGQPYRAFVSLQGHYYERFAEEPYRTILLRGLAWAGGRPTDLLTATPGTASAGRDQP